ncbi:MAG TPA: septation protein A [Guyparkeria sp.]|nr:septation protein A [Guyparkeria sp.]
MKFLFDFFPILLFFAAYHLEGIYVATAVAMIASMVQIAAGWLLWRKLERMHWISALLIMLFGGMTLILQNPLFIMWKPTIVNWLFALVFLGSAFVGEKPLVQRMMEHVIQVPRTIWHRVNLAWVGFFLLSGVANIWVAYQFPEAVWVNFKLFGLMGMTFVFMILQGLYLGLYAERPAEIETNPSQEGDKRQ